MTTCILQSVTDQTNNSSLLLACLLGKTWAQPGCLQTCEQLLPAQSMRHPAGSTVSQWQVEPFLLVVAAFSVSQSAACNGAFCFAATLLRNNSSRSRSHWLSQALFPQQELHSKQLCQCGCVWHLPLSNACICAHNAAAELSEGHAWV